MIGARCVALLCVLLCALVLIGACGEQAASRGDASGASDGADEVRVVALSPAVAIILRDLGFEELIVGRHGYDLVLDESLPICGDQAGIDYETLLRTRPTHIFLEWGARDLPPRLERLADRQGWEVESYSMLTLEDVDAAVRDMHQRLTDTDGEDSPAVPEWWTRAIEPRQGRHAEAGRVLLLLSTNPPAALGPGSAHHDLLERIGAESAMEGGRPHAELDLEDVLRLTPDAIVLLRPASPGAGSGGPVLWPESREEFGRIASLDIPAVRHGRLAVLDHPLGLIPSTSLAELAPMLDEVLAAWVEADGSGG